MKYIKIKDQVSNEIIYLNLDRVQKVILITKNKKPYYQFELDYHFVMKPGIGGVELQMQAVAVQCKWTKDLNNKLDQVTTYIAENNAN